MHVAEVLRATARDVMDVGWDIEVVMEGAVPVSGVPANGIGAFKGLAGVWQR